MGYTQAYGLSWFKELGNKAERKLFDMLFPPMAGRSKCLSTDCLAKTQVPANPNKGSIGAETCPVLVSQSLRLNLSQDR